MSASTGVWYSPTPMVSGASEASRSTDTSVESLPVIELPGGREAVPSIRPEDYVIE